MRQNNLGGISVHNVYGDSMSSNGIVPQLNTYLLNPYRAAYFSSLGDLVSILLIWFIHWLWQNHIQRTIHSRYLSLKVMPQLEQLKYISEEVVSQSRHLAQTDVGNSDTLEHYQNIGQQWSNVSSTLLNGLNLHSESDCKLTGDIKTWIEATIDRMNAPPYFL